MAQLKKSFIASEIEYQITFTKYAISLRFCKIKLNLAIKI